MVGSSGWVVGVALVALGGAACEFGHSCTDIGCRSGVSVGVAPKSGAWQDGHYLLTLALDDKSATCSFTVPDDLPAPGSISPLDCGPSTLVELGTRGDVVELGMTSHSEPKTLKVELSRDGTSILNESQTLPYRETQPNPGCVPICRNASVEFMTD